jgi:Zn-dependent protease
MGGNGMFFFYAAVINVNLAVFNLLPIPPLDGSRLATALLPAKYYYKVLQYERYIMIGLFVLLFTGVLTTPLSRISGYILVAFDSITSLPF